MDYILQIATLFCIYVLLAESYNLILGYTGMVHVGHIAFMAVGAYTSALLTTHGVSFWISLPSGMLAAGLLSLLLAIPTVRLKEDYLVAATLGVSEIIRLVLLNERQFTGGSLGINKIFRPALLSENWAYLIFVASLVLLAMYLIKRLTQSNFGKVLEAIREDEIAAESLGKNTKLRKIQILVIGGALAGLAGGLYAYVLQFIDPDQFSIQFMIFIFLMVVFGGVGKFWGAVLGTAVSYAIYEVMRFLPFAPASIGPLRWIVFSSILIVVILYKPTGLLGDTIVRKRL